MFLKLLHLTVDIFVMVIITLKGVMAAPMYLDNLYSFVVGWYVLYDFMFQGSTRCKSANIF